jgi:hypothetical protein
LQLGTVRPGNWRNIQVTVLLLVAVAGGGGGVGGDCGGAGLLGLGVEAGRGGNDCQEDDDSEQDEGQQTSAALHKKVVIFKIKIFNKNKQTAAL